MSSDLKDTYDDVERIGLSLQKTDTWLLENEERLKRLIPAVLETLVDKLKTPFRGESSDNNYDGRAYKIISLLICLILFVGSYASIIQIAIADTNGITVKADRTSYSKGNMIKLFGEIDEPVTPSYSIDTTKIVLSDPMGNEVKEITVGQQVMFVSSLTNLTEEPQPFVDVIKITDSLGTVVDLSWISGVLGSGSTSVGLSWTPNYIDDYTIHAFTFASMTNLEPISALKIYKMRPGSSPVIVDDVPHTVSLWIMNPKGYFALLDLARLNPDGSYVYQFRADGRYFQESGQYEVNAKYHDSSQTTSFRYVDERDITPPTITVPPDIIVDSDSFSGRSVTFIVSAADYMDGSVDPLCTPSSGSTFPVGDTRVRCTASDFSDNKAVAEFHVIVNPPNKSPVASIVVSSPPKLGTPISFSASESYDPDGRITRYQWDFGDGTGTKIGETVKHTYDKAGQYNVRLTVIDNSDAKTVKESTVVVAESKTPQVEFTSPSPYYVSEPITFTAEGTSDVDGTISLYQWEFGDGDKGSGFKTTHAYQSAAKYIVRLTATDNDGNKGTKEITLDVVDRPGIVDPIITYISTGIAIIGGLIAIYEFVIKKRSKKLR